MKIERPDWNGFFGISDKLGVEAWFNDKVEPINKMLSEGVEVFVPKDFKDPDGGFWGKNKQSFDTHKALLINIQPIKKETAEDVLRDILENEVLTPGGATERRAKAVLAQR